MTILADKTPRVSVLMPAFNRAGIIGETIQSVLDQTFTDFEFLICDDCSSDNTVEVIRSFDDPRIRVFVNNQNSGSGFTRNRLLDAACGEFCAIMDDDDICLPERLQVQVDYLDTHPRCDVVTSAMHIVDRNNNDTGKQWYHDYESNEEFMVKLLYMCPVGHPTMLIRRSRLNEEGVRYNPPYWYAEDMHLHCQLFDKLRYENLKTPLYRYRIWDGGASIEHRQTQLDQAIEAFVIIHRKAGMDVSESDREVIRAMHKPEFTPEMLPRFREYVYRLVQANRKTRLYDSKLLKTHMKRLYKNGSTVPVKQNKLAYWIFKLKLNIYG